MTSASSTLSTSVLKKAIERYYKQLQDYKGRADYELAVRIAFLNLLNETTHQVSEDKRNSIVSDPNILDDEEYIVRLVGKVITVSVETVRLVNELTQVVKMEDWMNELVEEN